MPCAAKALNDSKAFWWYISDVKLSSSYFGWLMSAHKSTVALISPPPMLIKRESQPQLIGAKLLIPLKWEKKYFAMCSCSEVTPQIIGAPFIRWFIIFSSKADSTTQRNWPSEKKISTGERVIHGIWMKYQKCANHWKCLHITFEYSEATVCKSFIGLPNHHHNGFLRNVRRLIPVHCVCKIGYLT